MLFLPKSLGRHNRGFHTASSRTLALLPSLQIRKGQYEFHEEYWGQVSDEAKALIKALLTVDPDKRYDGDQAMKNRWIGADAKKLANQDLGQNLDQLKKFNAKRKFKAAVKTVVAVNKMQSLGMDFKTNLK